MAFLAYGLVLNLFFLCSLLEYNNGFAVEPTCSKFPYEEALLEKMIRLEFSVEKMLEGMKETRTEVKNELAKIKAERESVERMRDEIDNKIKEKTSVIEVKVGQIESDATNKIAELVNKTESQLVMLEQDVTVNLEHAESVISRMSEDLKILINTTWQTNKEKTKGPIILFRASNVLNRSPSRNQRLIFMTVLENQGGGYNKDTGTFTAPLAGTYLFSVQLCLWGSEEIFVSFTEDSKHRQPIDFENHSSSCGSSVYLAEMKQNSEMWIESMYQHSSTVLYPEDDLRSNVFSGILINSE